MEQLKNWVAAFPGFAGMTVTVDAQPGIPGSVGLFCRGQKTLWQREDLLGRVRRRRRLTLEVTLACSKDPQGDCLTAALLLELARWAEGSAPILGQEQTLRADKGSLHHAAAGGVGVYALELIFEFTEVT